jgi:hypothetical protein
MSFPLLHTYNLSIDIGWSSHVSAPCILSRKDIVSLQVLCSGNAYIYLAATMTPQYPLLTLKTHRLDISTFQPSSSSAHCSGDRRTVDCVCSICPSLPAPLLLLCYQGHMGILHGFSDIFIIVILFLCFFCW